MSCIVYGCSNSNYATADPSVQYYVFPKHPAAAQQWIDVCGWTPEQIDVNSARICSNHFDESSYTTEIKMIDYITCYTKVLKYDAVPTLYLPTTTQILIKEQDDNPNEELREMIVFTVPSDPEHVTIAHSFDSSKKYFELQVQPAAEETIDMEKYKHITTKEELSTLENCNKTIREKVTRMENAIKMLKTALTNQVETYKQRDLELSNLHQEYLRVKRSMLSFQEQKLLLSKVFSESQIKILSGKKKIYWSNDDMAVGYTIRHLSNRRCYMYLTKKLNIPLPAVSSIKRWMTKKNSKMRKGLNVDSSANKDDANEDTE